MTINSQTLSILIVDDDEDDFIIIRDLLSEIGEVRFNTKWVSSFNEGVERIREDKYDVCLIDYRLGEHTGLEFLQQANESGYQEPIILMTGHGEREVDLEAMRAGATDFLVKSRIDSDSLERSIRYSIERKRAEKEQQRLISELQDAIAKIKTLSGMLPICSSCKRIRDDTGYWNQLEEYITDNSHAELSHSICPTCMEQIYRPALDSSKHEHSEEERAAELRALIDGQGQ